MSKSQRKSVGCQNQTLKPVQSDGCLGIQFKILLSRHRLKRPPNAESGRYINNVKFVQAFKRITSEDAKNYSVLFPGLNPVAGHKVRQIILVSRVWN